MTYTPNRITTKDFETEEITINANSIQRNLDLISKETKSLQNQINDNKLAGIRTTRIVKGKTRFVQPFLFGS